MLARAHALVVATAVAAAVAPRAARAEVVDLPRTLATITVGPPWTEVAVTEAAAVAGVVAGYEAPGGLVLAITRAAVPNPDAWRSQKREAYVLAIERGLGAAVAGYRRTARAVHALGGVPVLDLEARRATGALLVVRVLLFRTYALSLVIEVPGRAQLATARDLRATFTPPVPPRDP